MEPNNFVVQMNQEQFIRFMQFAGNNETEKQNDGMRFRLTQKTGNNENTVTHDINFFTDANKVLDNNGNTWLHIGAETGCEQMIEGFIRCNPKLNLNESNNDFDTPLRLAVKTGREEIVRILLEAGAYANAALDAAVEQNNLNFVKLLLEKGAEPNFASLAPITNRSTAEILFNAGATPSEFLIHESCREEAFSFFLSKLKVSPDEILENTSQKPLLLSACGWFSGRYCILGEHGLINRDACARITSLLKAGANPNHPLYNDEKNSPFYCFSFGIQRFDPYTNNITYTLDPIICLEITQLFIKNGATMDAKIIDKYKLFLKYAKRKDENKDALKEIEKIVNSYDKNNCIIS